MVHNRFKVVHNGFKMKGVADHMKAGAPRARRVPGLVLRKGIFHKMRLKHLNRDVSQFQAKHNLRDLETLDLMWAVVMGMNGKQLNCDTLIADNGLSNGAQS